MRMPAFKVRVHCDLKDFARASSLDVVYSETGRDGNGRGFVEFETAVDLKTAVEKLDNREFKGQRVSCVADTSLPAATVALALLRAVDLTECPLMATIVDPLRVGTVLVATAMIIVIEAPVVTTMTTAGIGRLRAADQLMSMAHPAEGVMTTLIDESIRPPTHTSTVVPTIVPHETFLHVRAVMGHVKVAHILGKNIGEEATDLQPNPGMN
ncbi:hypothetical protein ONZ43_g7801 [Nemania bipapillata]|uniref:Uncharacterized protein n=1 Tax=Nemania bipapillata TaxID=110536 RepID=A0ACC2HNB8_9PEZI|nr:hypothetical protein ONZ43_g7801 [Nemania bipapillata]